MINFGATKHVCGNRNFDYTLVREGEEFVSLGDYQTIPILGKGEFRLKLTFEETLLPSNVLYVSEIQYNLIFVFILRKAGINIL